MSLYLRQINKDQYRTLRQKKIVHDVALEEVLDGPENGYLGTCIAFTGDSDRVWRRIASSVAALMLPQGPARTVFGVCADHFALRT
jgi:hypothetical protein